VRHAKRFAVHCLRQCSSRVQADVGHVVEVPAKRGEGIYIQELPNGEHMLVEAGMISFGYRFRKGVAFRTVTNRKEGVRANRRIDGRRPDHRRYPPCNEGAAGGSTCLQLRNLLVLHESHQHECCEHPPN